MRNPQSSHNFLWLQIISLRRKKSKHTQKVIIFFKWEMYSQNNFQQFDFLQARNRLTVYEITTKERNWFISQLSLRWSASVIKIDVYKWKGRDVRNMTCYTEKIASTSIFQTCTHFFPLSIAGMSAVSLLSVVNVRSEAVVTAQWAPLGRTHSSQKTMGTLIGWLGCTWHNTCALVCVIY